MEMKIPLPREVIYIIENLNQRGYQAYAVGGCVRDSLLGRTPQDWDLTTDAKPEAVIEMFDRTLPTGLKHGTVTVVLNSANFEVTTFRLDGRYSDHRRPESVRFTSSLRDDLSRRDFTVNAVAYHPGEGVIDPFEGAEDMDRKVIRAVGTPACRFQEDALRMLRAIRFSAQLDFGIESATFAAIKQKKALIQSVSAERIREELSKILVSAHPRKFVLLYDAGLLHYILPEFEACFQTAQHHPYHIFNVAEHTLQAVESIENDRTLRWVMLLHDIGKPGTRTTDGKGIDHFYGHPAESVRMAEVLLKRLRFDNKTLDKICRLVKYHDRTIEPAPKAVRRAIHAIGDDIFSDLLKVKEADKKAQNPKHLGEGLEKIRILKNIYAQTKENHHCTNLKDLAVNGNDLIALGVGQGRNTGEILDRLLKAVIDKPELNQKEALLELAMTLGGSK